MQDWLVVCELKRFVLLVLGQEVITQKECRPQYSASERCILLITLIQSPGVLRKCSRLFRTSNLTDWGKGIDTSILQVFLSMYISMYIQVGKSYSGIE